MNMLQRIDKQLFSGIVPEALTLPVGGPCYACGDYVVDDDDPIFHPRKPKPFDGLAYYEIGPQSRMRECERCGWRRRIPWMTKEAKERLAANLAKRAKEQGLSLTYQWVEKQVV